MKKFKVQKVDLEAELELFDGSTETLNSPVKSAGEVMDLAEKIRLITEEAMAEEESKRTPKKIMDYASKVLEVIYDRPAKWFMENIDHNTILELKVYAEGELMRFKKSGEN